MQSLKQNKFNDDCESTKDLRMLNSISGPFMSTQDHLATFYQPIVEGSRTRGQQRSVLEIPMVLQR